MRIERLFEHKKPTWRLNFISAAVTLATLLVLLCAASVAAQQSSNNETLRPVTAKTDLYPVNADAKKDIDAALATAKTENKRVILIFGGNWCYDCHVLDQALHEGEAEKIVKEHFLLVHVDIGEGDKNLDLIKKYETTLGSGVPTLVIIDHEGRVVYSSTKGEFEAARQIMKKDLVAFLKRWKPPAVARP
jgi:thiol:disulfide interchange protein